VRTTAFSPSEFKSRLWDSNSCAQLIAAGTTEHEGGWLSFRSTWMRDCLCVFAEGRRVSGFEFRVYSSPFSVESELWSLTVCRSSICSAAPS